MFLLCLVTLKCQVGCANPVTFAFLSGLTAFPLFANLALLADTSGKRASMNQKEQVERAVAYLSQRYDEQCFAHPTTRDYVTRDGYIKANLPFAIRNLRKHDLGASNTPSHYATVLP